MAKMEITGRFVHLLLIVLLAIVDAQSKAKTLDKSQTLIDQLDSNATSSTSDAALRTAARDHLADNLRRSEHEQGETDEVRALIHALYEEKAKEAGDEMPHNVLRFCIFHHIVLSRNKRRGSYCLLIRHNNTR